MKRVAVVFVLCVLFLSGLFSGFLYGPVTDRLLPWIERAQLTLIVQSFRICSSRTGRELPTCVDRVLRNISSRYGARTGLDAAVWVAGKHPELTKHSHDLAHTVGYYALRRSVRLDDDGRIRDMGKALVDCYSWGVMGCMHGVIESAVMQLPKEKRTDIVRRACMENPDIAKSQVYRNHCLHWAGHGMAIFTDQTLLESLAVCEALDKNRESENVQLCVSGIFHSATLTGDSDGQYIDNLHRVYSREDVYFPCNDVPERFRRQCYAGVPGRSQTKDLDVMFSHCHAIPEDDPVKKTDYIHGCYDAAANYLSTQGEGAAWQIVADCRKYAKPEFVGYCYAGALRYTFLRDPTVKNKIVPEICRLADDDDKKLCYTALGAVIHESFYSESLQKSFCGTFVPVAYRKECDTIQEY